MPKARLLIANGLLGALTLAIALEVAGCGLFAEPVRIVEPAPRPRDEADAPKEDVKAEPAMPAIGANDGLNATLWVQTSAEYNASTRQAYALGKTQLDRALVEKTWTAALEQESATDIADKPPAIIVDVDETVLDNSAYQARLIKDKATFKPDTWNAWCNERKAQPIPGAVDFAQYAAYKGVTIFYISNRDKEVEDATRQNLDAHGFPFKDGEDTVLTKNEKPEWNSSDKTARRQYVAANYRIILLVGDNFGDFIGKEYKGTPAEREALANQYKEKWGTRWIMLPNPMYGSWETALFGHDNAKPADAVLKSKWDGMKLQRP